MVKTGYELFGIGGEGAQSKILFAGLRFILAGMMTLGVFAVSEKGAARPIIPTLKANIWAILLKYNPVSEVAVYKFAAPVFRRAKHDKIYPLHSYQFIFRVLTQCNLCDIMVP